MNKPSKVMLGTLALAFFIAVSLLIILPNAIAPNILYNNNYKNTTLQTRVNITHSKPDVLNVTVYEFLNFTAKNVTVTAGASKTVVCNATVRSWEGFNDITLVNATLYHQATSSHNASDDNSSHYTNTSCTLNQSSSTYVGTFVCGFDMLYYANNGTWICNVTISNSYTPVNPNFTGVGSANTTIYPVYALNVTDGIDYGNVVVEDYSAPDRTANITNLGNMGINISAEGYGVSRGDGLAMNCSKTGNITVANEKFSTTNGTAYASKTSLVGTLGGVPMGLTIPKQTVAGNYSVNATYWELYIPPNPAGNCTGYIIFTATTP